MLFLEILFSEFLTKRRIARKSYSYRFNGFLFLQSSLENVQVKQLYQKGSGSEPLGFKNCKSGFYLFLSTLQVAQGI